MSYFVRFVNDKNQAIRDFKRGYSFSDYLFFDNKKDAMEEWSSIAGRPIQPEEIGRCKHGFGLKLNGLCGFEYPSFDEAIQGAIERDGYNGVAWPMAAIYQGILTGSEWDGDTFRPTKLVKVINLEV